MSTEFIERYPYSFTAFRVATENIDRGAYVTTFEEPYYPEWMIGGYLEWFLKSKGLDAPSLKIQSLESENNSLKSRIAELESELELEREMVADLVFYSGAIINPVTRCLSYNWRKLKEIVGRARQRIRERKA